MTKKYQISIINGPFEQKIKVFGAQYLNFQSKTSKISNGHGMLNFFSYILEIW